MEEEVYYIGSDGHFAKGRAWHFDARMMNAENWETLKKLPANKRKKYIVNLALMDLNKFPSMYTFRENPHQEEARQIVLELEESVK